MIRISKNIKPSNILAQRNNGTCECRLYSGFKSIDNIVHGFGKGEVCVLASAPSRGKTALALNFAECVASGRDISGDEMTGNLGVNHPVMIVSLGKTMRYVINRMSMSMAGWRQGVNISLPTAEEIAFAEKEIATLPIHIKAYDCFKVVEISRVVSDVRRMVNQHRIELVIIDDIYLLCDSKCSSLGRFYEFSHIMEAIKFLAQGLNCAILLLAEASRPTNVDWKDYKSVLSDLRWNSPATPAIESLIDVLMLLNRPLSRQTPRGGPAFLNIAKNCHGETGEIELEFVKSSIRFAERSSTQT